MASSHWKGCGETDWNLGRDGRTHRGGGGGGVVASGKLVKAAQLQVTSLRSNSEAQVGYSTYLHPTSEHKLQNFKSRLTQGSWTKALFCCMSLTVFFIHSILVEKVWTWKKWACYKCRATSTYVVIYVQGYIVINYHNFICTLLHTCIFSDVHVVHLYIFTFVQQNICRTFVRIYVHMNVGNVRITYILYFISTAN